MLSMRLEELAENGRPNSLNLLGTIKKELLGHPPTQVPAKMDLLATQQIDFFLKLYLWGNKGLLSSSNSINPTVERISFNGITTGLTN